MRKDCEATPISIRKELSANEVYPSWVESYYDMQGFRERLRYSKPPVIAVIDTGMPRNNEDLDTSGAFDIREGFSVQPLDMNNHGSHVSHIVGAKENDLGITGGCSFGRVVTIKGLGDSGSGTYKDVVSAIHFAIDMGVDGICLSLGGSEPYADLNSALIRARGEDVLIAIAAGNTGESGDANYPALYKVGLIVGSHNKNGVVSVFSRVGNEVSICAAGEDVVSCDTDGNRLVMSGTSMAAPFVLGIACSLKAHKDWIDRRVIGREIEPTVSTIEDVLLQTSDKCRESNSVPNQYCGFGIINPYAALVALEKRYEGSPGSNTGPIVSRKQILITIGILVGVVVAFSILIFFVKKII